ncbi:MFS general substrate transporter [Hypoxylon crocopeplum]|nr:MFS general substrate transporter [Hypoxylon crocopeplum]
MTSESQPVRRDSRQITLIDREEDGREEATETSPLVSAGAEDNGTGNGSNGKSQETWIGFEDFAGLPWWRRPSVYWLLGPYFLFTLAFGGILVPKLNLIVDLVCRNYFTERQLHDPDFTFTPIVMGASNRQCNIAPVQKSVATFTLILSALTGALSAITAPKLGSLSDRYGRKRLTVIASCGGLVNEFITILAAKFPETVDYHWLIMGAFFDGITGSFTAGSVLGHSYVSDCAPPSKRGVHIGYLHACLYTGLAFGPLLAGYFVEWTGSLISIFYVVLGCHAFVILYFWFILPDSISKKRQMAAREKHRAEREATVLQLRSGLPSSVEGLVGSRVASIVDDHMETWLPVVLGANPLAPLKILIPGGRGNGPLRRNLIILALIDMMILSAAMGAGTVIVLYSEFIFDWGTLEASRFVSIVSMARVVILLCIFPIVNYVFRVLPLRRKRRESGDTNVVETNSGADNLDVWLLRFALLSDGLGTAGYIFVRREELFVLCGLATAFGGLASATIQSSITKHVPAERVGSILGATGLMHALGRVFAPALFNGVYAGTVETFPQAFFVLLASLFGLSVLGSFFVRPHCKYPCPVCFTEFTLTDFHLVHIKEDGFISVPVRVPGDASDPDIVSDEEIPSETLPRI